MSTSTQDEEGSFDELLLAIAYKLETQEFDLPPLPQVASRVLAFTADPDASAPQLIELIQHDPVLTAKIFQISNSVAYGARQKIGTLSQAVSWLGLNTIAGTAYALSVQTGVFDVQGYEHEVNELWTHALASGFYGKAIAGHIGQNAESAFLCGILHGIGKPFIVHTVNQYQRHASIRIPWCAMCTLFKDSSMEVSRRLSVAWKFPDPIKDAISLYEDHAFHLDTSPMKAAAITNLAHHFASHFVNPETISDENLRALPVVQNLKISEQAIDALLDLHDRIQAQVDTMLI